MDARKILVVSGDYELIHQTRAALTDLGFSFQGAYSHRDAQNSIRNAVYDAIIVHSKMHDRRTGEHTTQFLADHRKDTPLIVYQPDQSGSPPVNGNGAESGYVVSSLEDASIRQVVLQALHHFTAPIRSTQLLKGRDDAEYWDVDEVQTRRSRARIDWRGRRHDPAARWRLAGVVSARQSWHGCQGSTQLSRQDCR
jgi:hypothetical protein